MHPNPDDDLNLEALFETGLGDIEHGDLFPLPSMPLLEEKVPDTPPVGHPTEETGEVTEIAPEIDNIRVGDIVKTPDGKKMKVQWVDPTKKRVGLGKKRKSKYVFYSFAEIETVSGKKVAAERKKEQKKAADEIADAGGPKESPPPSAGDYMPDIPINPATGKAWPYPFQMESIEFVMRPKSRGGGGAKGAKFRRGASVEIVSGPDAGAVGRVFWVGTDKYNPGKERYGVKSGDDQTYWASQDDLREAQIRWIGGLVADEMGLGKTLTGIVCTVPPAVAVVPALLKVNWAKEYAKFRPELTTTVIEGGRPEMVDAMARRADVIIINYDIIHAHVDWIIARQNKTLIADEAHYLKTFQTRYNRVSKKTEIQMGPGKTTRRTKAFYDIRFGMPADGRPILLTGTPVLNRTKELYPLLYFIDPVTWGDQYAFLKRYCGMVKTRFGMNANGRTNTEELHQRINNHYMIRHTKEEVLTELPQKERSTQEVSLTPQWRKKYIQAARNFLEWIRKNGGPEAVAKAMRAETLVRLTKLRAMSAAGKAQATINYITEFFISTQRPLVVMGVHKQAFSAIAEGLDKLNEDYDKKVAAGKSPLLPRRIRYGKVLGDTPKKQRQKAIDDFQERGTLDVILYSIHIATGTTLTRSQDMVFFERLWRPADQVQAEDRIHRIGQKNTCKIVYLDGAGTIDAKLGMLLMEKSTTAAGVIDGVDLSTEMASMLVFGEMVGMQAGFIDGLDEILDDAAAIAGEKFDGEDEGSGAGDDELFENPRVWDEPHHYLENNPMPDIVDENGDWIDDYGEVVEELEPNPGEDDVTDIALDSWWDPR